MDDDLDELLGMEVEVGRRGARSGRRREGAGGGGGEGGKGKCVPVFVAHGEEGRTVSPIRPVSCSSLRCSKCCFAIQTWEGYAWDDDVDYLFMRHNFPEWERVSAKLSQVDGTTAFACQCSWTSISSPTRLKSLSSSVPGWFCSGHK